MSKKKLFYNLSFVFAILALVAMLVVLLPVLGAVVIGAAVVLVLVGLLLFWLLTIFVFTNTIIPLLQKVVGLFNLIVSFAQFTVKNITPYAAIAAIVFGFAALVFAIVCRKLSIGKDPEPVPDLESLPKPEPPTAKALKIWKKATKKAQKKRKAIIRQNANYIKCTAQIIIASLSLAAGIVGALLLLPPVQTAILSIFN